MNTQSSWKTFFTFALRVIIAHTITYFLFGLLMSNVFHYGRIFEMPVIRDYMLPMDQHNVLIGPFMQPLRGLLFAIALWPLRGFLIEKKRGWLVLWGLLVIVGILSTPAASPGSVEGVLYTRLPIWYHLIGFPEIGLQTLVFSIWLIWWERQTLKNPAEKVQSPLVAEIVRAVMAACFAYIGYAIGGLILAAIANAAAARAGSCRGGYQGGRSGFQDAVHVRGGLPGQCASGLLDGAHLAGRPDKAAAALPDVLAGRHPGAVALPDPHLWLLLHPHRPPAGTLPSRDHHGMHRPGIPEASDPER